MQIQFLQSGPRGARAKARLCLKNPPMRPPPRERVSVRGTLHYHNAPHSASPMRLRLSPLPWERVRARPVLDTGVREALHFHCAPHSASLTRLRLSPLPWERVRARPVLDTGVREALHFHCAPHSASLTRLRLSPLPGERVTARPVLDTGVRGSPLHLPPLSQSYPSPLIPSPWGEGYSPTRA